MKEFISKEAFDAMSCEEFNEIMHLVKQQAVEEAMRILPNIVRNLTIQAVGLFGLKEKFYQDNPDFNPHRDLVASIVEEVESTNPDLTYREVLVKATPIIRQKVKSKVEALTNSGNKPNLDQLDHLTGML